MMTHSDGRLVSLGIRVCKDPVSDGRVGNGGLDI